MKEILEKIKPNTKERQELKEKVSGFINKLNKSLKDAKTVLGGSGAKGTWLSGSHDVDLFVLYPLNKYAEKSMELSNLLEKSLKKSFPKLKISRVHGSRDYFKFLYQDLNIEVIPILEIKKSEQAINITDVSPLHTKWVNKQSPKVKDGILLAKGFCKANSLYGAESYISGFSGYVLEILVSYYGSFEKLLKASLKWKSREVVDIEKFYPKKDALFHLNKSKIQSPIIVVDPVDKNRNAAAALSNEKATLFKKLARKYLKKPSTKLFAKENTVLDKLKEEAKKKKQNLIYLVIKPLKGKRDVVGSKLLKAFNYLKKELDSFIVKKAGWEWEEKDAVFYFLLAKEILPEFEIRLGPPTEMKDFVKQFKKKNKLTYIEKDRVMAKIKNKHQNLDKFVNNLLKQDYFTERVGSVNLKVFHCR